MNNFMYSMGRRERIGLLLLARGRWGKILFLATIAVWSSTSSPASNKTPHSIALSGDTAVESGGHGRCRLGEWQMSLWTSWIYDPQFDPKWFVASNSCRYCIVLAFSSLRATPADEGYLFFPRSLIAAEKLRLCCHLTSRTWLGVSSTGTKHILRLDTYSRERLYSCSILLLVFLTYL